MKQPEIQSALVKEITQELKEGKLINKKLPSHGKLRIENNVPFLLIYRYKSLPFRQTVKLVLGESSYLITSSFEEDHEENKELLQSISKALSASFGSVMFLEIWEGNAHSTHFKIKAPEDIGQATVATLSSELAELSNNFSGLSVQVDYTNDRHPNGLKPLMTIDECQEVGCFLMGLEVPPFYRNPEHDEFYYLYFRTLKNKLSRILRKTIFEFIRIQTSSDIESYHALGSRTIEPVVWE